MNGTDDRAAMAALGLDPDDFEAPELRRTYRTHTGTLRRRAKEIEAVGQREDRQRMVTRIRSLARDPRPFGSEKLSGREGLHRIRVGRYRVVYSVDDAELTIVIVRVGHRKNVYR